MNVNFSRFTWLTLSLLLALAPPCSALTNTSDPSAPADASTQTAPDNAAPEDKAAPTPADPAPSASAPAPDAPATPPSPDQSSAQPTEPVAPKTAEPPAASPAPGTPESSSPPPAVSTPPATPSTKGHATSHHHKNGRDEDDDHAGVGDQHVRTGEKANDVVSILGNSTAEVEVDGSVVSVLGSSVAQESVSDAVVAVLGNARAEKKVGQSVVAVLGNATANGHVGENVVAVLGNIELGPNAEIDGDVVSVGGQVHAAPGSVIHGHKTVSGGFGPGTVQLGQLPSWFQHCLFQGRFLAFRRDVVWAWIPALVFLLGYVLFGVVFSTGVRRCAETLEQRPGWTILATLLTMILTPLLLAFLLITIFGGVFLFVAILIAAFFGKAALYAWLGRRFYRESSALGTALAVLIGGVIFVLLFTIPVIGLLAWIASGALGLGMVVYTLVLSMTKPSPSVPTIPVYVPATGAVQTSPTAATTGVAQMGVGPPGVATSAPVYGAPINSGTTFDATGNAAAAPAGAGSVTGPASSGVPPQIPLVGATGAAQPPPLRPLVSAATLPRAGFGPRLLASLLDLILVGFVSHVIGLGDLFLLLYTAYCVCLWALKATTLGGIICGLKLVRLDDRPIDWTIALIRALGAFLSLAVIGIGFLAVNFDDEAQSWHDKIAGTTIVRVPKGQSLV